MRKIPVLASALGIFAGLGGGVLHGIGGVLQGSAAPNGIMIEAWPAPQAVVRKHAMTAVPNFLLTGILAIITGIVVTMWAGKFIQRKSGGLTLILLLIVMLLVGRWLSSTVLRHHCRSNRRATQLSNDKDGGASAWQN